MKFEIEKVQFDSIVKKLQTDNLQNVIDEYNCVKSDIKYNGNDIYPGKWIVIENLSKTYHSVKPLETLESISVLYDISPQQIIQLNKLKNNKLFIGQRLLIK